MMNKMVVKVVLVLGTLVACFLGWQIMFNQGGIVKKGYNSVATGVNTQYTKVAGGKDALLPLWDEAGANTGGKGFDIDVK